MEIKHMTAQSDINQMGCLICLERHDIKAGAHMAWLFNDTVACGFVCDPCLLAGPEVAAEMMRQQAERWRQQAETLRRNIELWEGKAKRLQASTGWPKPGMSLVS